MLPGAERVDTDSAEDVREGDEQDRSVDGRHERAQRRVGQRHPLVVSPRSATLSARVRLDDAFLHHVLVRSPVGRHCLGSAEPASSAIAEEAVTAESCFPERTLQLTRRRPPAELEATSVRAANDPVNSRGEVIPDTWGSDRVPGVTRPRWRSSLVVGLGLTVDDVDGDLLAQIQATLEDLAQLQQIRLLLPSSCSAAARAPDHVRLVLQTRVGVDGRALHEHRRRDSSLLLLNYGPSLVREVVLLAGTHLDVGAVRKGRRVAARRLWES